MAFFRKVEPTPEMMAAYQLAKDFRADRCEVHLDNGTAVYIHHFWWVMDSPSFDVSVQHPTKTDDFGDPITKMVKPYRIKELAKILETENASETSPKLLETPGAGDTTKAQ